MKKDIYSDSKKRVEKEINSIIMGSVSDISRKAYKNIDNYKSIDRDVAIKNLMRETNNMRRRRNLRVGIWGTITGVAVAAAVMFISFLVRDYNSADVVENINTITERVSVPTYITANNKMVKLHKIEGKIEGVSIKGDNEVVIAAERKKSKETLYSSIIIPTQQTYKITLQDSSVITLNSGSTLKFPESFSGNERVVYLEGEAYFDISKQDKPFIVKLKDSVEVKVYGTKFNINSRSDIDIKTVLVSGSIGVKHKSKEVMITPSQMANINTKSGQCEVKEVNILNYIDWMSNRFICNKEPLRVFFDKVENWYGLEFDFDKDIDLEEIVDINLEKYSNVIELIEFLTKSMDVDFIRNSKYEYSISKRGGERMI